MGLTKYSFILIQNVGNRGVNFDIHSTVTSSGTVHTGVASITVDTRTGDNLITVIPGANHHLSIQDVHSAMEMIKPTIVLVQLEIPLNVAFEALKMGHQQGALTILNPAPAPKDPKILSNVLPFVDILVPNESELKTLYSTCLEPQVVDSDSSVVNEETMASRLLAMGLGKAVIVTLGARGALVVSRSPGESSKYLVSHVNASPDLPCSKEPVIDTIGKYKF